MEILESADATAPPEEIKEIPTENEPPPVAHPQGDQPVPMAVVADAKTPAPKAPFTAAVKTPATGPTPPSGGAAGKHHVIQPISALNPYMHGWSIRAKVLSKGPKRSFNRNGAASAVFSAELVDEQGTAIEGTFWRDAADRYYDSLQEGKVYVFSRGSVKPANKNYARTRNDYCLHFDASVEIDASEDGSFNAASMTARMQFVPIDQLAAFVDKKMPVDIIGVVTEVGQLASVKRKADATEIMRRDITLVDSGLKTVGVTLWGTTACEEVATVVEGTLATGVNPVLGISSCRVSSYNGISVSTLSRSQFLVDPSDAPEAEALRTWWMTSGQGAATTPVGEGLATAIKPGQQGGASAERRDLAGVKAEAPSTPDAKPVYATVRAAVASINPQQSMWYLACPENNRKVVEQEGGTFYCEYDGRTYSSAIKRYIMQARLADDSGELPVQLFNDQAEVMLGRSADDLASLKESDPSRFNAVLSDATWTEWVVRLKAQAQ